LAKSVNIVKAKKKFGMAIIKRKIIAEFESVEKCTKKFTQKIDIPKNQHQNSAFFDTHIAF
jgi:hypothetical protein